MASTTTCHFARNLHPVPNIAAPYVTGRTSGGTCGADARSRPARSLADLAAHARGRTATPLIDLAVLALRIHNQQIRS